ncbi:ABC transporter permease [Ornithinimicrobium sp. F0845]|uniref:ABC transporter permease subunit n=1 Tax=Ornithinimicrobium sp. F0845 TaxID=2926412 RepID=UPI001FF20212|nr:ABC transporter permease subunit [Ornithinimicrobium sp. F0845]MCK0113031.1 ABC transporter permease [Ornithinimicrobium sp. F0845]
MTTIVASARADLLRVRKWSATWVIGAAWLVLMVLFGYVFNYVAYRSGSGSFATEGVVGEALLRSVLPANVPQTITAGTPMFGGALMMVLGAMVAASGYGWGSWKTILTQGPSRFAVAVGSLLSLTAVVAVTVLASVVMALGISTSLALVEGVDVVLPSAADLGQGVGIAFLVLLMWALFGYLLGTLLRGPALAVGLGLVWSLVVENLLRGVGSLLGWVETLTTVLPGTAAGSLVGSLGASGGPEGAPGVLTALSGTHALVTVLAYVVLLPLLAVLVIRRRDLA